MTTLWLSSYAANGRLRPHLHQESSFTIVVRGGHQETSRSIRSEDTEHWPGSMLFCAPSEVHSQQFGSFRMDEFIKLHRKSNPGERPDEFISLLRRSVADARHGVRCRCGAPIWAIGSAVVGNACFTCITGEADPSSDYEIDGVLKGRARETLVAQVFVDGQSSKVFRSRRGRKTTKPSPKMQG
jgi:hypothetical protein